MISSTPKRPTLAFVACLALAASGAVSMAAASAHAADNDGQARIVGGTRAPEGAYPFMAKLSINTGSGTASCGGTLISKDVILTAQHCMTRAKSVTAYLGNNTWKDGEQRTGSNFKMGKGIKDSDWAIIKLDSPSSITKTSLLPADASFDSVAMTKTMGWGTTSAGGSMSNYLLEVNVPFVKAGLADCKYGSVEICAGDLENGGIDSCQGDSGGPLFGITDKGLVQTGIVSWGIGCAEKGNPGHYAKVSAFLKDISNAITSLGGTMYQTVGATPGGTPAPDKPTPPAPENPTPDPQEPQPGPVPEPDEPETPEPGDNGPLQVKVTPSTWQATLDRTKYRTMFAQFSASWCGPCKTLTPIMKRFNEQDNSWIWAYIDVDKNGALANKYSVRSYPDTRVFKDGKHYAKLPFTLNSSSIRALINKYK